MSTGRSKVSGIEPKAYAWDFDGACVPLSSRGWASQETFSVGIFQWLPKRRSGLKRVKVVHRIFGHVADQQAAYDKARAYLNDDQALKWFAASATPSPAGSTATPKTPTSARSAER